MMDEENNVNENPEKSGIIEEVPCGEEKPFFQTDPQLEMNRKMEEKLKRNFRNFWLSLILFPVMSCCVFPLFAVLALGNAGGFCDWSWSSWISVIAFLLIILLGIAVLLLPGILVSLLYYRYWKIIPHTLVPGMTPAKALGFLFIPYFSCYWNFRSFWKLGRTMEKCIAENKGEMGKTTNLSRIPFLFSITQLLLMGMGIILLIFSFATPENPRVTGIIGIFSNGMTYIIVQLLLFAFYLVICILGFVMLCQFQRGALEILRSNDVRWQANPAFSRAPIFWGIFFSIAVTFLTSFISTPNAVMRMGEIQREGNRIQCQQRLFHLTHALQMYQEEYGKFPETLSFDSGVKNLIFCSKGKNFPNYIYTPLSPGKKGKFPILACPVHKKNTFFAEKRNGHYRITISPAPAEKK